MHYHLRHGHLHFIVQYVILLLDRLIQQLLFIFVPDKYGKELEKIQKVRVFRNKRREGKKFKKIKFFTLDFLISFPEKF